MKLPQSLNLRPEDRPIVIAGAFVVAILIVGTAYTMSTTGTAPLLSPGYLMQQLQIGSFFGICAAGMMVVILLGHIDLSIPWTLTSAAMLATAVGGPMALPVALAVGLAVGLFNGFGVAFMRIPSMIFTLGVDTVLKGLMVAQTGGFAPQDAATPLMLTLAKERLLGIPIAIFVWAGVSVLVVVLLRRTTFGRAIYATGTRERAAYLSGIRTRAVIVGAFVLSALCASLAGVLLTGYSAKAYQGMGNAFLLPAIAAVVLGGTSTFGGVGGYTGTILGALILSVLNSMLTFLNVVQAIQQVVYGVIVLSLAWGYAGLTRRG